MKEKERQGKWGVLLSWILLSAIGWIIGLTIGVYLAALAEINIGSSGLGQLLGYLILGAGLGSVVGLAQWLVLRGQVSRAGWWILASAAGIVVAYGPGIAIVADTLEMSRNFLGLLGWVLVGILGGAITGIFQWFVLRGQVSRAGWWVLASALGWGLSMLVGFSSYWTWRSGGVMLGVVTGGVMVWLLQQPKPED